MTLREFIKEASQIKDELQDKEIVIKSDNNFWMTPKIKFIPKENMPNFVLDSEHVDKVIITIAD